MMKLRNNFPVNTILLIFLLLFSGTVAFAQTDQLPPEAAFLAYDCEFQKATNSVRINAVLMGSDGLPIPRDNYTMLVSHNGESLDFSRFNVELVPSRPPIQMMLVLDITDTVPMEQIINALTNHLVPQLNPNDEVALITFSEEVSPPTQFYTDKNRLMNEHVIDLQTLEGENHLYDAILEAVKELPFNSDKRQVVLVLTDSNRRDNEQTASDTIVREAQQDDVQVFSIGYFSRDMPDVNELIFMANGTEAFAWIYGEVRNTRASIEAAVSDYLQDFTRALNSEIAITVDISGMKPDANDRLAFDLSVDPTNEAPMGDQINCSIERLQHSIAFISDMTNTVVTGPVDIGVTVQSEMNMENLNVVFRSNGEIVQNSSSLIYTFPGQDLQPGYYEIGAQLVDRNNEVLAFTSSAIRLYVQGSLTLNVVGDPSSSADPVYITASTNANFEMTPVQFFIATESNPEQRRRLSDVPVPFQAGRAQIVIDDFPKRISEIFPQIEAGEGLLLSAVAGGVSASDANLGVASPVDLSAPPPPAPAAAPLPRIEIASWVPIAVSVLLLVFNYLLFRWVGYMRIRRLINHEDDHELGPQLMTITVYREGIRQSHTLTKKTMRVGRGKQNNDINLGDNANISRQHGFIVWRKRGWYYTNGKRLAGTRINGKWKRGYIFHKLEPVTELEIGNALLVFHSSHQQDVADYIKTNF